MTIEELVEACQDGTIDEMIRVCELRQVKALGRIADTICAKSGVRLVLLAGASAAGKTTTAKRLCTQLRVNDATATLLSTDDYFVGDDETPRNEKGELDYEHVDCVDIPRFVRDMNALIRGETIHERKFDFVKHEGYDSVKTLSVRPGGYIVVEGIHALNPRLTEGVDEAAKFRMFIEPKTQLTVFALSQLPTTAGRFMRRLVRDFHFRKMAPMRTFKMWPNVLAGEKKWIEPFRQYADAEFDSGLAYEPAVLKPYVEWPLRKLNDELGGNPNIGKLIALLEVLPTVSPNAVPGNSILRETIGGSQLEY